MHTGYERQINKRLHINKFQNSFTTVGKLLSGGGLYNLLAVMSGINVVCGSYHICPSWRCDPELWETIGCRLMNGVIRPLHSQFILSVFFILETRNLSSLQSKSIRPVFHIPIESPQFQSNCLSKSPCEQGKVLVKGLLIKTKIMDSDQELIKQLLAFWQVCFGI